MCRRAGYRGEPDHYSSGTTVVEFPIHVPHMERRKGEVSLWEKVDLAAQLQRWWSDNQVSCTADFEPEREAGLLPRILETYEDRLKAIAFLPARGHGYEQAPYEEIGPAEYREVVGRLSPLAGPLEHEHELEAKFCDGDVCDLP